MHKSPVRHTTTEGHTMAVDPLGPQSKILPVVKRAAGSAAPAQAPTPARPATSSGASDTATPDRAETTGAGRQPAVKLEDVAFGDIAVADPTTFAPAVKRIPDEHPLMVAFRRSYDDGVGLDVPTPDVDGMTKILRRIANQEGKGVHIKARPGVVAFKATERRVVRRKKD